MIIRIWLAFFACWPHEPCVENVRPVVSQYLVCEAGHSNLSKIWPQRGFKIPDLSNSLGWPHRKDLCLRTLSARPRTLCKPDKDNGFHKVHCTNFGFRLYLEGYGGWDGHSMTYVS